jgi:hypothetical protein
LDFSGAAAAAAASVFLEAIAREDRRALHFVLPVLMFEKLLEALDILDM